MLIFSTELSFHIHALSSLKTTSSLQWHLFSQEDRYLRGISSNSSGCRTISEEERAYFLTFVGVSSTYPAPESQHLYSDSFFKREDRCIREYLKEKKPDIIESCYRLIERYRTDDLWCDTLIHELMSVKNKPMRLTRELRGHTRRCPSIPPVWPRMHHHSTQTEKPSTMIIRSYHQDAFSF